MCSVPYSCCQAMQHHDLTLHDNMFQVSYAKTCDLPDPPTTNYDGNTPLHQSFQCDGKLLQRLIGPLQCTTLHLDTIADLIRDHTLHCCSDGSVHKGKGSHAWLMADATSELIISGAGPDEGSELFMSSYRSELGGLTALLCLLYNISQLDDLTQGQCVI